jgi:lipopolysaccharide export system permease protein
MHRKYLINLFFKKILLISSIFLCLVFIMNLFEEVSFFKDISSNIILPLITTTLNAPSILYLVFPFIFLISAQLFFIELIEKNELELLKINGYTNTKILSIIALLSFIIGLFVIVVFYNFSSKLKFIYLEIKNKYSLDDKYLAVINQNGLWIKDIVNTETYIVNATKIEEETLRNVTITIYDKNFEIKKIISSKNVDISKNDWVIKKPIIFKGNISEKLDQDMSLFLNFDIAKINRLFKNLSSLNFYQLYKLKEDYSNINYSYQEIDLHIKKIISFPFYLTIMSVLSSIIMLNIKRNNPQITYVLIGIFSSVTIYYINVLFQTLGKNGTVPLNLSIWIPIIILSAITTIGLIRINEK